MSDPSSPWAAVGLCVLLLAALPSGFPVAFLLAGVATLYALALAALGGFDLSLFAALPARIMGMLRTPELAAVPMFIFMGAALERSGVADQLLRTLAATLGRRPGGLGLASLGVGAALAACAGVVAASVSALATLAAPSMRKAGYADPMIAGVICAAGSLGQILPPSILLIFLSVEMQTAFAQAQRALGVFAPDPVTSGALFAAAIAPGLLLVALYGAYVAIRAHLNPAFAPASRDKRQDVGAAAIIRAVIAPFGLIVLALGSIVVGAATPTEAAGLGALGAVLLAGLRKDRSDRPILAAMAGLALLAILGRVQDGGETAAAIVSVLAVIYGVAIAIHRMGPAFGDAARATLRLTAMAFAIVIGASIFALVFRGLGGGDLIADALSAPPGGVAGAVAIVMAAMFVLGFFFDFLEILFVVLPLTAPPLLAMGVDPLWLAVMIAVNLQTSFLTPPFGYALFYFRGAGPKDLRTTDLYRGVAPFVALQLLALFALAVFPDLATALPNALFP